MSKLINMWRLISSLSISCLIFLGTSCGVIHTSFDEDQKLFGSVPSLVGKISHTSKANSFYAYAGGCSAYVDLIQIDENDLPVYPAVASTPVKPDGSYAFTSATNLLNEKVDHILEVRTEGNCEALLQRPLTHIKNPQIITPFSTVVTAAKDAQLSRKFVEISKTDMEKILQQNSEITSYAEAYGKLLDHTSEFKSIFGDVPTKLENSAPVIQEAILPAELIKEGSVNNFRIMASHWSPDYKPAVQWKLNGETKAQTSQWSFVPSPNSQGVYQLEVYVGSDDGTGKIDTSKPYHYNSKVFTVDNNILPSPPQMNISNHLVTSTDVTIRLLTGPGMINCESFSSLSLTVEDDAIPVSFLFDCESPNSQDLDITLPGGDGIKTIRLWARDGQGTISSLPTTLSLTLDQTKPSLSLTAPNGYRRGGDTVTIPLNASDANGISQFQIYSSTDNGVTFSILSNLAVASTSYNWTLPVANSTGMKLKIVASDSAGNTSELTSSSFTIDSTPPAKPLPVLTSGSPTNVLNVSLSLPDCSDYSELLISESISVPAGDSPDWKACSTSLTTSLSSSVNGDRNLYVHARDIAGNTSSSDPVVVRLDQLPPIISFSFTLLTAYKGGDVLNIQWSGSDLNFSAAPIKLEYTTDHGVSWQTIVNGTSNDGMENWNLPLLDTENVRIRITATDLAGNTSSALSGAFSIESTPPVITAFSVNNNSGESSVFGAISLEGISTINKITHFCVKTLNSDKPLATDACWIALNSPKPGVTPAKSIQFSDYDQMISFTPGPVNMNAWIKTESQIVSEASTVPVDVLSPNLPTVSNILVANVSSPSDPVLTSEKLFNGSQKAFIKWKVTSNDPVTVSLHYVTNSGTTDIVANLENGSNNGCIVNDATTVDDEATGCYEFNNAPSEYFYIIVRATNQTGVSSQSSSYPLNVSRIKILAGNTDLGLNTSALSSVLRIASGWGDPGSIVVTTKGRIFFRDLTLGLLTVDPKDGIIKLLMPITGVSAGDGGPAKNGTLNFAYRMALDYQDRVLIYDKTRIRRINTNTDPMTIETIIGSSPTSTVDGTPAANFKITSPTWSDTGNSGSKHVPFFALPNGDIYFSHGDFNSNINEGNKIYRYQASDQKIYSFTPFGYGHGENPTIDIQTIRVNGFGVAFDPKTSQITTMHLRMIQSYTGDSGWPVTNLNPVTFEATAPHPAKSGYSDLQVQGMDGKLYVHNSRKGSLERFEPDTGTWTRLVGGGTDEVCADNTPAIDCSLGNNKSAAFFVTATGQIYFTDRFGIVRVVLADNSVRRIMGQSKNAGDDGPAAEARLNNVNWIAQADDGTIFMSDATETTIRKFQIDSNISHHGKILAENILLNKATKELYSFNSGGSIQKFPFATKIWSSLGTTSITYESKLHRVTNLWGYDGTQNFMYQLSPAWTTADGYRDYKLGSFNITSKLVTVLTGYMGTKITFDPDGTPAASAATATNQAMAHYDATVTPARWLMLANSTTKIYALNKDGMANNENLVVYKTLPSAAISFVFRKAPNNDEIIYYCGTDKKLHSVNFTTSTTTHYEWPMNSLECAGKTLLYNSDRNSLIFPARMNNLSSVIEYKLD